MSRFPAERERRSLGGGGEAIDVLTAHAVGNREGLAQAPVEDLPDPWVRESEPGPRRLAEERSDEDLFRERRRIRRAEWRPRRVLGGAAGSKLSDKP